MTSRPFRNDPTQLKVLDVGIQIAGPIAATFLGDLGAEVIKCEQPGIGDPLRHGTPRWQAEGRNKRSVTLNLRVPEGQALVRRLAAWADILVENFRPGTMAKWNLGYEELAKINPRLVYVSVSGFGQTGPYAPRSGFDFVGSAFGGLTELTGYPDRPPVWPGLIIVDYATGLFAAVGALEAVRRREAMGAEGRGSYIDGALYETVMRMAANEIIDYSLNGAVGRRVGGAPSNDGHPESATGFAYKTRDGRWLTIFPVGLAQMNDLRRIVRDPALDHEKFSAPRALVAHSAEFYTIVSRWTEARDYDDVWAALATTTVPASPINDIPALLADPHVQVRESVVTVPNAEGKPTVMPTVIPRLSPNPGTIRWAGEPLGASNDDVYKGLLGLSDQEIASLKQRGVI